MSKYHKHFLTMLEENSGLFDTFKAIHDQHPFPNDEIKEEFNTVGQKILRVIRRYENELCSRSENTGYGKFSTNLSEKFWEEIRGYLPHIDSVELR